MTAFNVGDHAVATVRAQGLVPGRTYEVTEVEVQETPFGSFVTYVLDGCLRISNGHLLLQRVEEGEARP